MRIILTLATASILGAGLGYFGPCTSGTCPLTANWRRGALYGSFLGLLLLLVGCVGREADNVEPVAVPIEVRVAPVVRRPVTLVRSLAGTVRPLERATVAARTMGSVAHADFVLGQNVSAGQLLLALTAPELPARREQAVAALAQAKRELARESDLAAAGASSTDALRAATDRLHLAEAMLHEADALLDQTQVTAPLGGVVTRKFAYSGDVVQAGTPLFEVEARDRLRVELQVPDTLPVPATGTPVRVDLGVGMVIGSVDEISPAADPLAHTREARIRLAADATARSGQFVRVDWPAGASEGLVVPSSCLAFFGQIERVFVVHDGRAELRLVRPGPSAGDEVQILSGVAEGEILVVAPPATLRDGDPVRSQR